MYFLTWVIQNKELVKVVYALAIAIICAFIVIKTDRLFRISMYKGIRYFRNAFLFYGIAIIIRYIFGAISSYKFIDIGNAAINFMFEYFMIMGGFFLLYSLLWGKIDDSEEEPASSLFNSKISLFYAMAFIIVLLDYLWNSYYFLFSSQIILFLIMSIISFMNYVKKGKNSGFLKLYFIAMLSGFTAWMLNALASIWLRWNQGVLIVVYILNVAIFLLFLYGVIKATKRIK